MNDLLQAARAVRAKAYAPYSGFSVGCALRSASGRIYTGCNVENAAYPQGLCAERVAIGAMIAAGEREIAEVVVIGSGEAPCAPCGGCRQGLAEFAAGKVPVHMHGDAGASLTMTMAELLPAGFGPKDLGGKEEGEVAAAPMDALAVVRNRAPGFAPKVAIVLGSGLGGFAGRIELVASIPYGDLPGLVPTSISGHAGTLMLGHVAGVPVCCFNGRVHLYEGHPAAALAAPVRLARGLGADVLVLTNSSGSLDRDIPAGSLALLSDHINMQGTNPLVGPNDPDIGPRFVDMSDVYSKRLRARLHAVAAKEGLALKEGVYVAVMGPVFETPAEIRAFRTLGADLVGMSTVLEAMAARHCGLEVVAISTVVNLAAGLHDGPLSHDLTLQEASAAAPRLERLLAAALPELIRDES